MPVERQAEVQDLGCAADLVPQAAIDAAVLAASKGADDGHTDCYYAGILLAAWPHLQVVPLSVAEALADALEAQEPLTREGYQAWKAFRKAYPRPADQLRKEGTV